MSQAECKRCWKTLKKDGVHTCTPTRQQYEQNWEIDIA